MAEVEFAGVKFTGGKFFVVVTALSTLVGGLYGGFEVYKDYMDMKEQIQSYVAPDLSGFDKQLAVLQEDVKAVKEISAAHVEVIAVYGDKLDFMQNGINANEAASRDMKNDMRDDIAHVEKIVDALEDDIQDITTDVRNTIDIAEGRFENKRDALQNDYDQAKDRLQTQTASELTALEARLNKKLQRALDNPLAN